METGPRGKPDSAAIRCRGSRDAQRGVGQTWAPVRLESPLEVHVDLSAGIVAPWPTRKGSDGPPMDSEATRPSDAPRLCASTIATVASHFRPSDRPLRSAMCDAGGPYAAHWSKSIHTDNLAERRSISGVRKVKPCCEFMTSAWSVRRSDEDRRGLRHPVGTELRKIGPSAADKSYPTWKKPTGSNSSLACSGGMSIFETRAETRRTSFGIGPRSGLVACCSPRGSRRAVLSWRRKAQTTEGETLGESVRGPDARGHLCGPSRGTSLVGEANYRGEARWNNKHRGLLKKENETPN